MDAILVISDEATLAQALTDGLANIAVTRISLADAAALKELPYRLIIADEPARTLPESVNIPTIRLARPVRLHDLLYTIKSQLQTKTTLPDQRLGAHHSFSPGSRMLSSNDGKTRITLTQKEVELLSALLEAKDRGIARDALLARVWGYSDDIATHTLETHIYRLRGKLTQADPAFDIVFFETTGYRLKVA